MPMSGCLGVSGFVGKWVHGHVGRWVRGWLCWWVGVLVYVLLSGCMVV